MDFQALNGAGGGTAYEIKKGKRVGRLLGAGYWFRAPEFWKNLLHVGGPESAENVGISELKGEPLQSSVHTVRAVPAVVQNVAIANLLGKTS
jgi:hypothetical protein